MVEVGKELWPPEHVLRERPVGDDPLVASTTAPARPRVIGVSIRDRVRFVQDAS
jgi:hypothetical protein